MALLILLLIVIALAALGVLGFVLKVAFGVALGVFLALVALGMFIAWRVRRAWRRAMNTPGSQPSSIPRPEAQAPRPMQASSEVTVLRPDESGSGSAE
jgi:hypothetical protein